LAEIYRPDLGDEPDNPTTCFRLSTKLNGLGGDEEIGTFWQGPELRAGVPASLEDAWRHQGVGAARP